MIYINVFVKGYKIIFNLIRLVSLFSVKGFIDVGFFFGILLYLKVIVIF